MVAFSMTTISQNNKRIAKNTIMLYIRMLLIMVITLYTSRIVLQVLGVTDFGIYNVVGGVVAMFSVLSGSLSAAISRFITFELGRGDKEKLKKVFSTAVNIQLGLSIAIFILAEIGGVWFLNEKMNIPQDRIMAAHCVLQFSIFTFMINLISVPYYAAIIAHERMSAFAYISIIEATLKLGVVYLLVYSAFDKLMSYAVLLFITALIVRFVYGFYCKRHFEECTYHFVVDRPLVKEMTGFAGWNFIGVSSSVLRDQGVNIVINLFCGPTVNSARGIAFQINSAICSFIYNFTTAINPQITKSYATGNYKYMMSLVQQGSRFSFYLLLLLSLPVLFETKIILSLWLNIVPEYTVAFTRLVLVFALIESFSATLITAMLATGNIKNYQLVVGGIQLLNLPLSYLALKLGFAPQSTLIIAIGLSLCCLFSRLYMLHGMIKLSVRKYMKVVLLNAFVVSLLSCFFPMIIYVRFEESLSRFFLLTFICLCNTLLVEYFVGCTSSERAMIGNKLSQLKSKLTK